MMELELHTSLIGGEGGVCIVLHHTFPVHPLPAIFRVYYCHFAPDSIFHINYHVLDEKKDPIKALKQIYHFLNWKSKCRQELIQQDKHYHQGPDLSLSLWLLFHAMALPWIHTSWLPCCGSKMTVTVYHAPSRERKMAFPSNLQRKEKKLVSSETVNVSLPHWICLCTVSIYKLTTVREMGCDD